MIMNIDFVYPVGSIYISVNATNPSKYFGGTWEQITGDAYLKIVTSNAGSLGGTSADHKIPISSIPSHNHQDFYQSTNNYADGAGIYGGRPMVRGQANVATTNFWNTGNTGGSQAYYPYYYGVYVFKRIA